MRRPKISLAPMLAFSLCSLVMPIPTLSAPLTEIERAPTPAIVPQPATDTIDIELRDIMEKGELVAENGKRKKTSSKQQKSGSASASKRESSKASRSSGRSSSGAVGALNRARQLAQEGKYTEASKLLFPLSRNSTLAAESSQIKYVLGRMLFELQLYQSAAFVFYDVVREESKAGSSSKYLRQALEKLSVAADALDSDVLLKYAIKKVDENDFPAVHRDMLYYRTGEIRMSEKNFPEAARLFSRVRGNSTFFSRAKYKQALALAEAGELEKSQNAFEDLIAMADRGVTDVNRVSGQLGRARVLYQRQNWEAALDAYREIPRDTEQWHESLFEQTWAMLRSARFRSALSNFHSLHSDYYEDFYQPESLILRAIVYVYICRYDEMEKVLNLFDRVYRPVRRDLSVILKQDRDEMSYFKEIARIRSNFDALRSNRQSRGGMQIPFLVARHIIKEGDVRRGFAYIAKLEEERKRIQSLSGSWARSAVGLYAQKVVERRLQSTQQFVGKLVKKHMLAMARELLDLSEQKDLLVVETIAGKRETVKKEIAGKGIVRTEKVDQDQSRDFYIQNGYEYWPFQGEYWLDEIGNYHYVGVQACE